MDLHLENEQLAVMFWEWFSMLEYKRFALAIREDQWPSRCLSYFDFKLLSKFLYYEHVNTEKKHWGPELR